MRSEKTLLAAVERALPRLTQREWGAIAIVAARRSGLEGDDIFRLSLRIHLRAAATREHGAEHHDRRARR